MSERRYTLDELADLSGLKPRTIRHYIQQQLLLGPDTRGRSATYSDYHRKRLEVIKDLRNRRFPIEDIRKALSQAQPDEDIRVAVIPVPGMPVDAPYEDDDSALSFVHSRQQAMAPPPDEVVQSPPPTSGDLHAVAESSAPYPPPPSSGPIEQLLPQLQAMNGRRVARRSQAEPWVRFAATPDFEIHIRGPLAADQQDLFEQITDHIRHILLGGDPHA